MMIRPAFLRRAVWARHFDPDDETYLVSEPVDARIDSGDVNANEIAAEALDRDEMLAHLIVRRGAWLIQNAVEIDRLVIEENTASSCFDFSQTEMSLNLSRVSGAIDQLGEKQIQVRVCRRP